MSDINSSVLNLFEMQDLEDMMTSYQQAIITDPNKMMKLQMKMQQMEAPLLQQDPSQMMPPQPPQPSPDDMQQQDGTQDPTQQQ